MCICAQVREEERSCACARAITSKCQTSAVNIYLRLLLFLSPATQTAKLGERGCRRHTHTHTQHMNPLLSEGVVIYSPDSYGISRWHVAGKSECSAKCGSGYRSLDVQCMKYSLLKRQSERVDSSVCANAIKPRTRESCHGDCLLKSWQYSAWSQVQLTAKGVNPIPPASRRSRV